MIASSSFRETMSGGTPYLATSLACSSLRTNTDMVPWFLGPEVFHSFKRVPPRYPETPVKRMLGAMSVIRCASMCVDVCR